VLRKRLPAPATRVVHRFGRKLAAVNRRSIRRAAGGDTLLGAPSGFGVASSAAKSGSIPALSRNGEAPLGTSPVAYLNASIPVLG